MKNKIQSSEITPKKIYLSRRDFFKSSALLGGAALLAACTKVIENPALTELALL